MTDSLFQATLLTLHGRAARLHRLRGLGDLRGQRAAVAALLDDLHALDRELQREAMAAAAASPAPKRIADRDLCQALDLERD